MLHSVLNRVLNYFFKIEAILNFSHGACKTRFYIDIIQRTQKIYPKIGTELDNTTRVYQPKIFG
jgi:hypothetical protein